MTVLAVYAVGEPALADWARRHLAPAPSVVTEEGGAETVPPGAVWLCPPGAREQLASLRPQDPVVVIQPPVGAPWGAIAHEVRGPVGVVSGALDELEVDDPMLPLARRGVAQLKHLGDCWSSMAETGLEVRQASLPEICARARDAFGELEPRRARRVTVEGDAAAIRTDPSRVERALVRALGYATRAARGPVTLSVTGPRTIELRGVSEPLDPGAADLFDTSPRLATAVAVGRAVSAGWARIDGGLRWELAAIDA